MSVWGAQTVCGIGDDGQQLGHVVSYKLQAKRDSFGESWGNRCVVRKSGTGG